MPAGKSPSPQESNGMPAATQQGFDEPSSAAIDLAFSPAKTVSGTLNPAF